MGDYAPQEGGDFSGAGVAVEEFPTESEPADYALFVQGQLLGIIEAKRVSVGAASPMEQAKRYSRGVEETLGEWRKYRVPFLYSTNGELIYFLDVRKRENQRRQLSCYHTHQALWDKFRRNTEAAELWFQQTPVEEIKRLRDYQVEAIRAMELEHLA